MPARPTGPADLSSAPLVTVESAHALALTWQVAPGDEERFDLWADCYQQWLASKRRRSGRDNTYRAYSQDWADFFSYFSQYQYTIRGLTHVGLKPWHTGRLHARKWADHLAESGLSKATVIRKIAAMSSFYAYASDDYVINDPEDGEIGLWRQANPFHISDLPKPEVNPIYPTSDEVQALLDAIPLRDVVGWRNLALIYGIFITTKRVTEWTELKAGDVHDGPEGKWFWYTYKGGVRKKQAIPEIVWNITCKYLELSGRPWPLPADDYVFVATCDAITRITRRADGSSTDWSAYRPGAKPISPNYVNHILKSYGARCGIDRAKLHAHGLRHAGARCRHEHGADIWACKTQLGHASIATTQRYTEQVLELPVDPLGQQLAGEMAPRQLRFGFAELLKARPASSTPSAAARVRPPAPRRQRQ